MFAQMCCRGQAAPHQTSCQLKGAMSLAGPESMVSVGPSNETNDRTTPAWINGTSGVASDGGSEELPVSLQPLC